MFDFYRLPGVDPKFVDVVIDHAARLPSPHSAILLFQSDGALNELPPAHSPAGNRDAAFVLNIAGSRENAADDAARMRRSRGCVEATRAFSTGGTYANFLTEEEGRGTESRRPTGTAILDPARHAQEEVRSDNLFHHTENVSG